MSVCVCAHGHACVCIWEIKQKWHGEETYILTRESVNLFVRPELPSGFTLPLCQKRKHTQQILALSKYSTVKHIKCLFFHRGGQIGRRFCSVICRTPQLNVPTVALSLHNEIITVFIVMHLHDYNKLGSSSEMCLSALAAQAAGRITSTCYSHDRRGGGVTGGKQAYWKCLNLAKHHHLHYGRVCSSNYIKASSFEN